MKVFPLAQMCALPLSCAAQRVVVSLCGPEEAGPLSRNPYLDPSVATTLIDMFGADEVPAALRVTDSADAVDRALRESAHSGGCDVLWNPLVPQCELEKVLTDAREAHITNSSLSTPPRPTRTVPVLCNPSLGAAVKEEFLLSPAFRLSTSHLPQAPMPFVEGFAVLWHNRWLWRDHDDTVAVLFRHVVMSQDLSGEFGVAPMVLSWAAFCEPFRCAATMAAFPVAPNGTRVSPQLPLAVSYFPHVSHDAQMMCLALFMLGNFGAYAGARVPPLFRQPYRVGRMFPAAWDVPKDDMSAAEQFRSAEEAMCAVRTLSDDVNRWRVFAALSPSARSMSECVASADAVAA